MNGLLLSCKRSGESEKDNLKSVCMTLSIAPGYDAGVCLLTPVCVHTEDCSGDNSVGLIGQHLLSFIDCVNPCGFDKVQIAVLHQRL